MKENEKSAQAMLADCWWLDDTLMVATQRYLDGLDGLRLNDLDHGTNLVYIERAITYVQSGMPTDACLMLEAFGNAEHVRLDEKLRLMLAANVERWPSPHQSRQHQLMRALSQAIERHSPLALAQRARQEA